MGELQVGRHAPGGGGRGHATQRGGAPQRVLPPTGRVEFTGGVLQRNRDQAAKLLLVTTYTLSLLAVSTENDANNSGLMCRSSEIIVSETFTPIQWS